MRKEMKSISVFGVLIATLIVVSTSYAGIGIRKVRVKDRLVPSPTSLEEDLWQMRAYRNENLVLPQCPGEQLLKVYEKTSTFVSEQLRKLGQLVFAYRVCFADENLDKMLRIISELEQIRTRILSAIRSYKFQCQSQCGGGSKAYGQGGSTDSYQGSQTTGQQRPSNSDSTGNKIAETGLSLLNLGAQAAVRNPVAASLARQPLPIFPPVPGSITPPMPPISPMPIFPPVPRAITPPMPISIPEHMPDAPFFDGSQFPMSAVSQQDPWLQKQGAEGLLGVLKSVVGIGSNFVQSKALLSLF